VAEVSSRWSWLSVVRAPIAPQEIKSERYWGLLEFRIDERERHSLVSYWIWETFGQGKRFCTQPDCIKQLGPYR
jgi:hypothetical protein